MKNKKPFVSVIVCTYNGVEKIGNCLKALLKQNYPKNKHEIIVVDDGSTDKTFEIVSKYFIKLIKHKKNLGIPSARNTGLKYSKGEIIAYIDDDCIANKDWLKNLIKPYENINIMGVGGLTKSLNSKTLTERYLSKAGYGNPTPIEFGKSKNPFYRFSIYLKNMFKPVNTQKNKLIQVQNIYGANCSFRKNNLIKIKGFDDNFKTAEDTEICTRLNNKFKDKKIIFNQNSIIMHKHHELFIPFLKQNFLRSENLLKYYFKYKKFPPIFPFPIFIILGVFISSYFNIFYGLAPLILLPQILYFWYPIEFLKKPNLDYLIFPYMQFSLELATILGMLRGFILLKFKFSKKWI